MDHLHAAFKIGGTGLAVQSTRMRVISENIANARSTGSSPGSDPYRRKTISFGQIMNRQGGVYVRKINVDHSKFVEEFDSSHPAADARGIVKYPNVNTLIEMADMREANRIYAANLQVIKQSRDMITMTIGLLKG
ncbi:Flagellar basal-body rod protein FlgC [Liberibacter crescens BT-1]|uniref:Flagellar basal-body rod protein FlgC n=1 Tax=Liberibacter crescens (strain BT-1) TaxID=1215343 RepID=L0ETB0_LIBCB|nr:flagellar basal body rod protein FlgC [Liberibacter crescens]AGA64192.1 Flagellar basal-body rod protein FlgC [Liberibacter crescens BT-1]AMC12449.1 flagellar basal body rod protein FlgC [Liberibacter crescens]